jgi:hypothetical protein
MKKMFNFFSEFHFKIYYYHDDLTHSKEDFKIFVNDYNEKGG